MSKEQKPNTAIENEACMNEEEKIQSLNTREDIERAGRKALLFITIELVAPTDDEICEVVEYMRAKMEAYKNAGPLALGFTGG